MNLNALHLQFVNVIVVYESIDLLGISRDRARALGQNLGQPIMTDVPGEVLLVIYPDQRIHCQYDRRRLTVQSQEPHEDFVGKDTLPTIVRHAMDAISQPRQVNAFGLNYCIDATLLSQERVEAYLRDRFLARVADVSASLQGPVEGAGISLKYDCPALGSRNTLQLKEETGRNSLRSNLNVHVESGGVPQPQGLRDLLTNGYDHFKEVLQRL